MAYTYLEFEKPISDLESKIENLKTSSFEDNQVSEVVSYTHLTLPTKRIV